MSFTRKRALAVAGGVATLFAAGGFLAPSQAVDCKISALCGAIEGPADDLGIIPDPTRQILKDIYGQIIYPEELQPVYSALNGVTAPVEQQVMSATAPLIAAENELSGEITPVVQDGVERSGTGVVIYDECDPKHDHKDHENHKHCED